MADLVVKIGAETTEFDRKLRGLTSGLKSLAGTLGVGLSISAGIAAVKNIISDLDALGKKSKNLGLTTDFLQKLQYAAEITGASFETVTTGIKYLQKNISEAKNGSKEASSSFAALGIPLEELARMTTEEQFLAIARAFNMVENQADKTALAMQVFGRSGSDMIDTLKEYDTLAADFEKSDLLIKAEEIAAAEAFNDAITKLGKTLVSIAINSNFLTSLNQIAQKAENIVSMTNSLMMMSSKLGARTGAGSQRASYRGGFLGFFANLKEAYFGEEEGLAGIVYPTEAELQKLEQAKEKYRQTGKTKRQRDEEEKRAIAERIASEKLAAEQKRAAAEQQKLDEKTSERLVELKQEIELQKLKNQGKLREAAIESAIYDARKQNKNLSEEQAAAIAAATGELFDLQQKVSDTDTKKTSQSILLPQFMDDATNQFLRVGAYMGTSSFDNVERQYKQKHIGLLEEIKNNTKKMISYELE